MSSVINYTSLVVNPGGPLRMSSCGNHYGARCNFSCAIGYRLNGTSAVTCVATKKQHVGVWNNSLPTCEGYYEFKQQIEIFKILIIFVSLQFIVCVWFLIIVITCPALPAPSNGKRLGCPLNGTVYYDTVCQFSCNNGYIGFGSQVRRCQHNGTWSGQDFVCRGTYFIQVFTFQ